MFSFFKAIIVGLHRRYRVQIGGKVKGRGSRDIPHTVSFELTSASSFAVC